MNNEEFNILNNIADILSSDPILGATLLVSQNIDLDLFVYHLLDNYNEYRVKDEFKYVKMYSQEYYVFGHMDNTRNRSYPTHGFTYNYPNIDDVDKHIKKQLVRLIMKYE